MTEKKRNILEHILQARIRKKPTKTFKYTLSNKYGM